MSKCKCSLREKSLGDGCRYCNPDYIIDSLTDVLIQEQIENDKLRAELKALKDKELTFCEHEMAKLKEELASFTDNVVAEFEGEWDTLTPDDYGIVSKPYSLWYEYNLNTINKFNHGKRYKVTIQEKETK